MRISDTTPCYDAAIKMNDNTEKDNRNDDDNKSSDADYGVGALALGIVFGIRSASKIFESEQHDFLADTNVDDTIRRYMKLKQLDYGFDRARARKIDLDKIIALAFTEHRACEISDYFRSRGVDICTGVVHELAEANLGARVYRAAIERDCAIVWNAEDELAYNCISQVGFNGLFGIEVGQRELELTCP